MNRKSFYSFANYSNRFYIVLSVLALSLGGLIYIFLRPSDHVFYNWISTVGLDNWFNFARHYPLSSSQPLPEWIVFSLPNGLWAFAYALLITSIWSGSKSWFRHLWMATIPLLVLGYEVLQYAGIIPGTFCFQDIALGLAGLVLGIIIGFKICNSNSYEKVSK